MTLTIKNARFYISPDMVKPALEELKKIYPNIVERLTYDEPATDLQLIMFYLGYHIKVNVDSSIFTISRCYTPEIDDENPITTLTTLSQYMTAESYIVAEEDGKEIRFEKNSKSVKVIEENVPDTTVPSEITESVEINESDVKVISKPVRKRNKRITAGPEDEEWVEK